MSAIGTVVPPSLYALDKRLREIGGCGDRDCIVIRSEGQHANGGCRCNTDTWRMAAVVDAYRVSAGEIRAAYHVDLLQGARKDLAAKPWLDTSFQDYGEETEE